MSSPAPEATSLRQALARTRARLQAGGIEDPDIDIEAELLMRVAIRCEGAELPSRATLYQRSDEALDAATEARLASLTRRRLEHEPSAYITGQREFWGMELAVTPGVLIPRPETELLVEHARALAGRWQTRSPVIVDVGTGSGAIAISLAKELPAATVYATDLSWDALDVARQNAARHGFAGRIAFRHGDLLLPIDTYVDLIVANLPYVTTDDWARLGPELRDYEPRMALDGGCDGLDLIRALLHQAPRYLQPHGSLCLEFGAGQIDALTHAAATVLPSADVRVSNDFAGIPRVLVATL